MWKGGRSEERCEIVRTEVPLRVWGVRQRERGMVIRRQTPTVVRVEERSKSRKGRDLFASYL